MTMTNNPTIDGVSRELLERLLTDACNENWSDLNELLHSPNACRCRRFGKDNPHWPCPVHSAQGDPTAAMTEAGCQAYMDADGMIGIMHNSSMGHAYVAMRAIDPEVAALQSTIARLEARVAELESGRGEPVAWYDPSDMARLESGDLASIMIRHHKHPYFQEPLFTAPPAPVAVVLPSSQELHILISKAARQADLTTGANYFTAAEFAAIAVIDATAALNGGKS